MRFLPLLLGMFIVLGLGSAGALAATSAPTVSITNPAAGATVSGTITVSGASSGASKVELKVDGGAYQLASGTSSWSKSISTTAYANGSHTLTARATDSTGHQVWASRTVTISNGSLSVSISSPASGATVSGTITVSGASSGASKVELKVDGGAYQLASGTSSWSKSISTTAYANGSHTLTARATKSTGSQVWASRTVTISNGSLSVSISSPASGATVSGTITVSGASSGASKVELKVDGGAYQLASGTSSWSKSISTTAYANGSHTLTARATKSTGSQVWASRTVTISNGSLSVSISSPASGATVSGTITVSGASSGASKVELKVDGGAYQLASGTSSWSKSISTTAYANGSHTLTARATKSTGTQVWASRTVTISNGSLSVSISSPASGATVSGTITVSGASSGASKVELKVDGGAYQLASGTSSWSKSISTTAYANGSHTLTARATKSTGSQVWASRTVTISNGTSTSGAKIYWGAWIGPHLTGGSPPYNMKAADSFEAMTGKRMSLIPFGSLWLNCNVSPCTYYSFPTSMMSAIRNRGSIPYFNWGSASSPLSPTQSNFQLRDITAGTYDTYIRNFATAAKSWGRPFFLNFNAEMNLKWNPWGVLANGNLGSDFVPAWRRVHDIFTSVGATNATWVWCPNVEYSGSYQPLSTLYPGSGYVDWTCIDGYNWGTNPWKPNVWQSFSQVFGATYSRIAGTIAPTKPMVIGETASTEYGGSKATWITNMLKTEIPLNFPKIKGILWFEKWDERGYDWPIETSSTAKSAFATNIKLALYAANSFASLTGGKVQPLSG